MRMLTALLRRLDSALSDDARLAETIGAWAARHNMYDFGPEWAAAAARALVANQGCWGTMCEIWTGYQCTDRALMEFADVVAGGSGTSVRTAKEAFVGDAPASRILMQPRFRAVCCVDRGGQVRSFVFATVSGLCAVSVTLPADSEFFTWCFVQRLGSSEQIRELFSFLEGTDPREALWGSVDAGCREFSRGSVPLSLQQWREVLGIYASDRKYRVRSVEVSDEVYRAIWNDSGPVTKVHLERVGWRGIETLLAIDRLEAGGRVCSFYLLTVRMFPRYVSYTRKRYV